MNTQNDSLPPAEAKNLSKLTPYADGSIVSRTLSETESGTLTLFSFDAGQALSEHTTPYEAFVYVLDGEANWSVADKNVTVSAGEMIRLPANVPHGVKADQRFKMLLTMFRSKAE